MEPIGNPVISRRKCVPTDNPDESVWVLQSVRIVHE